MEILIVLQIIGTIAFAVSGAVVGIEKKMDIFGVAILGLTTAVGGGILRDLVLNITPPSAFRDSIYAIQVRPVFPDWDSLFALAENLRESEQHKRDGHQKQEPGRT